MMLNKNMWKFIGSQSAQAQLEASMLVIILDGDFEMNVSVKLKSTIYDSFGGYRKVLSRSYLHSTKVSIRINFF